MPSIPPRKEGLPEPAVLPRKAEQPDNHRMRDAAVGGRGNQAGGDYGGTYSEEGGHTMTFLIGFAIGFVVGSMTVIVVSLIVGTNVTKE